MTSIVNGAHGAAGKALRGVLVGCLLIGVALASPAAHADDLPKRATPNYDGRGEAPTTVGEDMLWIPRVLLSPAFFVSEYVLRRPLVFLITAAESSGVLDDVSSFLNGNVGIVPTFMFDFGLDAGALASGGFYFWWDNLGVENHRIRLRAAFAGGDDWVELDFKDSFTFGAQEQFEIALRGRWDRRRDEEFGVIGSGTFDEIRRYGINEFEGAISFEWEPDSRNYLRARTGIVHTSYFDGRCCRDPSLFKAVEAGQVDAPEGIFNDGFLTFRGAVWGAIDSRDRRPANESGVRFDGRFQLAALLDRPGGWWTAGASVGGYVEIYNQRTLGLILGVDFAEPFGAQQDVPFTELVMPGTDGRFAAFDEGVLRGRSAITLGLEYRWPIWFWLDGWLFATVGNGFDAGLEDFDLSGLRASFGLGVHTTSKEDHPFRFSVAAGTEPFGAGGELTSLRFVFGTTTGF